jgi:hypothetical protein
MGGARVWCGVLQHNASSRGRVPGEAAASTTAAAGGREDPLNRAHSLPTDSQAALEQQEERELEKALKLSLEHSSSSSSSPRYDQVRARRATRSYSAGGVQRRKRLRIDSTGGSAHAAVSQRPPIASLCSGLHVRREGVSAVPRSRAISCRAVPTLLIGFAHCLPRRRPGGSIG